MTVNEIKKDMDRRFSFEQFQKQIESFCVNGVKQFKKIIRSYIFFHLFFISLLTLEMIFFFLFFSFFYQSSCIAFVIAGILLTGFSYLILLFYFQTKKPEQFLILRNYFIHLCKQKLPAIFTPPDYHLSLANAAYRFANHIEYESFLFSNFGKSPSLPLHLIRKFMNFCLHKDIFKMKEILLLLTIEEHIELIKTIPTNVEAHGSLANAYVALSKLYSSSRTKETSKELLEKFKTATKKAIQEFKIIDHYAPKDPWVHAQLASCYHDLQIYQEETKEYETILLLCPNDKEILFRLGTLYFHQGLSARGLHIYERLKRLNYSRADELIHFYNTNLLEEFPQDVL